jgi:hypothetical protein
VIECRLQPKSGHESGLITTNLRLAERLRAFGNAKMTTALLDRLKNDRHIVETGNRPYRFNHSCKEAQGEDQSHGAIKEDRCAWKGFAVPHQIKSGLGQVIYN